MSTLKKVTRNVLTVAAFAAGIGVLAPTNAALAMNQTPCNTSDLLRIAGHFDRPLIAGGRADFDLCAANKGSMLLDGWVNRISTGNNVVVLHDYNGAEVRIERNYVVTYNYLPHIRHVEIL